VSGDYIVDEVHRIREEIAKKYNYDISAIVAAAMKDQWKSGHKVVSFAPKSTRAAKATKRRNPKRSTKRLSGRRGRTAD
jgi:hypothetical protein